MPEIKLDTNYVEEILTENSYIPDDNIVTVVFLALSLKKPILIEGPPGTGKTELSKAISRAFERDFFRVQCYEGITFEQIVGEWNYQKQLLHLEMSKIKKTDAEKTEEDVFSEEFFIKRPLLSAFMNEKSSVILIDEIDKADEEVESFLLQALGEKQITVNDLGTFDLKNDLLVIMTSNSQRQLLDETKDRCLYLYIDYPTFEREVEIVKSHVPNASLGLIKSVVRAMQKVRKLNLIKTPSIRATVDWINSLLVFGKDDLDDDSFKKTINVVIKNEDDKNKVIESFKLD
ncbi:MULTISPECIES: AAA family ATPase [Methanobacterium]|jgi:MoxR-like ATPase|uniref:AAA family ATPase n=1 Tax=Methanobacterium bryantii TaxID=2161 RepID=A0A2A2H647_METBR|nr:MULTISPECIES: MoxR family ATPase [Methanobacterium]OEC85904.1 AAA family ATPase [Methanobacterium sp. A39]PAV04941.1 AAA family ATPase [Methanobacterium bryantii]